MQQRQVAAVAGGSDVYCLLGEAGMGRNVGWKQDTNAAERSVYSRVVDLFECCCNGDEGGQIG